MYKPRQKVMVECDYSTKREENPLPGEWFYRGTPQTESGFLNGTIVAKCKGPYYSVRMEIEGVRFFTEKIHERFLRKDSSVMKYLYV